MYVNKMHTERQVRVRCVKLAAQRQSGVKLAASDPVTGDIKLNYVKKILLYHFL
jgi:hypothetical protein